MGKTKEWFMETYEQEQDFQLNYIEREKQGMYELKNDFDKLNIIFVYGTLRQGYGNNVLLKDAVYLGEGITKDKYILTASGIPFVSKLVPMTNITGELYKIQTLDDFYYVDKLESHPEWYKREIITVVSNGEEHQAWIYFNDASQGSNVITTGDFNDYKY